MSGEARDRYVVEVGVGVEWCTQHDGVKYEDEKQCDGAVLAWTPCNLVALYIEATS